MVPTRDLRHVTYQHPDAQRLIADVQQEYVRRYGGPDASPVDNDEFSPPGGLFVLLYENDQAVAMGGWRFLDPASGLRLDGVAAELKRMYVEPTSRGRGHARAVLSHLEDTAAASGAHWLVLETGLMQPEAITLYQATGYQSIPAFGHYRDSEHSVHLGKRLALPTA